ncbi:BTAD domain-containing putative transcriptional regulator [Phytohabitans sp. LJ34]|uniref:AfsR/SARP family transcriptional regulator n=1 Tax=Phytohabitans sp. LJ34 TaxID=3452217 RepID=UPI003F8AD21C
MRYRILGELEVAGPRGVLQTSAPRQLVVLATLLLDANHAVSVDRLVDAVWDETPPPTARGQIQICVSALRRALVNAGIPDAIHTRPPGYLIRVPSGELDLQVFGQLAANGRAAVMEQRFADAAKLYQEAITLWRGPPFTGVESRLLQGAAVGLEERRIALLEESIEVRLQLGRHHELIGELMALTAENPVRERLRAQLMTALYRDGRQAEALEVYRQARQVFVEELGLEPGSALQSLERAILARELALDPAEADPAGGGGAERVPDTDAPPRMLPADIADFTGHETIVRELREVLAQRADTSPVAIAALSGKGGVGKTTLAVHVAHQLSHDFPDGQLYVTLRSNDARPVSPAQVLERFLRAMGVPGSALPKGLDERAEMYRDRLAGRRVLVVLDDATDEDQVAPLLPGTGTSAIVVTSRPRLTRLAGAHRVDVAVFDLTRATELLSKVAGEDRVHAEPEEVRSLVRRCGGLPLALRIAGARLAARPHWTFARLVARLEDERRRLDELDYGGHGVRSSLAVSYEALDERAKRLFRRLGVLEASDFDSWTAGALLDEPADDAEDALDALVDARLLDVERTGRHGVRYRLHDLIRVYARERLAVAEAPEERRAALRRVNGAWLHLAGEAHRREYGGDFTILHGTAATWPVPGTDELLAEPLDWYERERSALVAAVRQAAEAGLDELCWDLAMSLVTLFEARSYHEDWRETHYVGLAATRKAGNRRGEAAMLYSLGSLNMLEKRFDDAAQRLGTAAEMFTQLGDEHGRGLAERNLAYIDRVRGDAAGALARYERSLDDLRRAGDTIAEAHVLTNIAQVKVEAEEYEEAERLLGTALEIARKLQAKRVVAQALYRLGETYHHQGQYTRAASAFESVLEIVDATGDRVGAAFARYGLGLVKVRLGEIGQAESSLRAAQLMAAEAGESLLVAQVLLALGDAYRTSGRLAEALERLTAARDWFARIGATPWLSRAEQLLAETRAAAG